MEKSFIKYSIEDNEVVIENIYINPSERGNHKGYSFINEAVEFARLNNIETVSICAYPQDESITEEALIKYYRDYGFESDGDCSELMTYEA